MTAYQAFIGEGTELAPDSLALLEDFLDAHPDVAAVAPVTMHPDGNVREAGGVIGGDGWCRAYRADRHTLFPREVDYAGTACLLVRRAALDAVGGCSSEYATTVFRTADLALALRQRGWQTWVVPPAVALSSAPTESTDEADRAAFLRRWSGELAGRAPVADLDEHPHRLWWLRDRLAPYRVLLVDDRVPQPARGRGDPRTMAVLQAWRDADPRARVTFFAASADRAEECAPALRAQGVEVVWGVADPRRWSRDRAGLYDVLVVFRPQNFVGLGERLAAGQPQAVRVYEAEALFHRRAEQLGDTAEANLLRDWEIRAFNWADVAVCVSAEEAAWAREVAPGTPTHVVSHRVPVPAAVPGREERNGLMFLGGFDSTPGTPNELAVLELVERMLPELRRRHPGLGLRIVGADPSPAVRGLASGHVTVHGDVADPVAFLGSARLHVVPMWTGAGVKLKFVESMAAGLPFVTTPVGAEGLHLGPLAGRLVGESTAELIELCHALLIDRTLWTDVQQSLLDICREHFSAERFANAMRDLLADCGVAAARLPLRRRQPAAEQDLVHRTPEGLRGEVLAHDVE